MKPQDFATDSSGNTCYLVCQDDALSYVAIEVTDRGMPIGQGIVVGPHALRDAAKKARLPMAYGKRPHRIFALVEVKL